MTIRRRMCIFLRGGRPGRDGAGRPPSGSCADDPPTGAFQPPKVQVARRARLPRPALYSTNSIRMNPPARSAKKSQTRRSK